MRTLILILILLALPLSAGALEFVLQIDGQQSRVIEADSVVVNVRTAAPPPAEPPPPQTDCGQRPPKLAVINTGSMTVRYNKRQYNPGPADILAFSFTTPATGNHRGQASATRTSSSPQTKTLVISECPGDHQNPIALSNACIQSQVEVTQVTFTTNPNADPRFECVLEPGKKYYINAVSLTRFGSTSHSCTNSNDCGFSFMRDPS